MKKLSIAFVLALLVSVLLVSTVVQAAPSDKACWGQASAVFARFDEREFPLGTLARKAGGPRHSSGLSCTLTEPLGETFDLILRSSRQAAEGSLDVFEFWEGEVVFEDVLIQLEPKPQ